MKLTNLRRGLTVIPGRNFPLHRLLARERVDRGLAIGQQVAGSDSGLDGTPKVIGI
jgi:hypothetical protein